MLFPFNITDKCKNIMIKGYYKCTSRFPVTVCLPVGFSPRLNVLLTFYSHLKMRDKFVKLELYQ